MPMLSDKQKLMRRLQQSSFALTEANLYLDSHPTCKDGLKYYSQHKKEHDELMAQYTEKYGPIKAEQTDTEKEWSWAVTPFPWERGES